jgi:hypothetical protein
MAPKPAGNLFPDSLQPGGVVTRPVVDDDMSRVMSEHFRRKHLERLADVTAGNALVERTRQKPRNFHS